MDSAKDIWEGTELEGTDGINQAEFVSDKIQVDGGHKTNRNQAKNSWIKSSRPATEADLAK